MVVRDIGFVIYKMNTDTAESEIIKEYPLSGEEIVRARVNRYNNLLKNLTEVSSYIYVYQPLAT